MAAVTIADLIRDRRLLWVYCGDCGRERNLDPVTLPLPGEYPVPEVGKRMKCSACGSRTIHMAPKPTIGNTSRSTHRTRSPG